MVEVGWVPVTEALERLASGDTSVQAIEDSPIASVVNRLARKMRATEISTEATLATFPVPLLVFDAEGRVLMSTPAARALFIPGTPMPGTRSQLVATAQQAMGGCIDATLGGQDTAEGRPLEMDLEGRRARLTPRARAARDSHGRVVAVVVELRDGGRLQLVEALHYDLVATVAHELRTPLTSLHMSIHLCLEQAAGPLTDEQGILLSSAKEDCERLRLLAEELLDMGRLAAGRVTLDLLALAPQVIAQRAYSSFRTLAADKRIRLDFQVAENLPMVVADRERIHRVFSNLLSNALRHTPASGSITINASCIADRVRFEVIDTGEGIDQAHLAQVFEKFVRGPGKVHSGYGLGLCIARDIVVAHGGEIGVESQLGKGSSFWFTLQRQGATTATAPASE
jgi:NtrC-family two-component system sensor histidine kinase KinB